MGWVRRLSKRAEKTIRLVTVSVLASVFGILAVARDSELFGYICGGVVLAGILVGPLVERALFPPKA